jgi:hypothetical protein
MGGVDARMAAFNEAGRRGQASMNDGRYRPLDRFGQGSPRFNHSIESDRGVTLPAKPFGGSCRRPGRSLPPLDPRAGLLRCWVWICEADRLTLRSTRKMTTSVKAIHSRIKRPVMHDRIINKWDTMSGDRDFTISVARSPQPAIKSTPM